MRKKFSIKKSLSNLLSNFRGFDDIDSDIDTDLNVDDNNEVDSNDCDIQTIENEELYQESIENNDCDLETDENDENDEDDEDDDDSENEQHESRRERKRRLKKIKKERKKSFFKKLTKKPKKPKMTLFVVTVLLLFLTLFVYSISYLLTPTCTLSADISVVYGGYNINYTLCERPRHLFDDDLRVGDEFYFTQHGTISNSPRDAIKLRVTEITNDYVYLDFVANGVPSFLSTRDMQALLVESSGGKQVTRIYIKGKIVANRFSLLEIFI